VEPDLLAIPSTGIRLRCFLPGQPCTRVLRFSKSRIQHTNEKYRQMKSTYKSMEVSALDLAKLGMEAHGGLNRGKRFITLSVHGINGVFWGAKGKAGEIYAQT
jgi:hypothetical protein